MHFCSSYSFVAIIVFFTCISVLMVTVPISETPTKFDTESDIQNSKPKDYMEGVGKKYALRFDVSINEDLQAKLIIIIGGLAFLALASCRQFGPWFNEQDRFRALRVQPAIIPRGNQQVHFRDNRIALDPRALQLGRYSSEEED